MTVAINLYVRRGSLKLARRRVGQAQFLKLLLAGWPFPFSSHAVLPSSSLPSVSWLHFNPSIIILYYAFRQHQHRQNIFKSTSGVTKKGERGTASDDTSKDDTGMKDKNFVAEFRSNIGQTRSDI